MHYQIDHPLLAHKLTILRDKHTNTRDFRDLASEITMLLAYEALKHVELKDYSVETPLDMNDAWAQFHIREDLLPRFAVDTEFDARIPGLGD
ncbi:MAG: uracil phosphoribosyltransferase, partial [Spirochaetota bacterium]